MTNTYIVPAFVLVDAESIEQADELACELADTLNVRRNLAPGTRLRLDEGKATIEAPEGFAGESLVEIEHDMRADLLEACQAMIEWDDREQDHAVDFSARMELCRVAFDKARAAIAKATGGAA